MAAALNWILASAFALIFLFPGMQNGMKDDGTVII
jgi:hypothetical protein